MSEEVQKKTPFYKRTWFIAVAAIILVSSISNAFTSDEQSLSAPTSSEAQQTADPSESTSSEGSESAATPTETIEPTTTTEPTTTSTPKVSETTGQSNAKRKAGSYLDYSFFSRSGLIDQLLDEDFSRADAEYAVDAVDANWNVQAAGKADSYLSYSAF